MFEALTCVWFRPERDRLEATLELRRPFGCSGQLCAFGSHEHVRFYLSYDEGGSWVDPGVASANDIAVGKRCDDSTWAPICYICGATCSRGAIGAAFPSCHSFGRSCPGRSCRIRETLTRSRSGVMCTGVTDSSGRHSSFADLIAQLPEDLDVKLPPYVLQEIPSPIPDPGPLAPLPLAELVTLSAQTRKAEVVPEHRFALPHLSLAPASGAQTMLTYVVAAQTA